MLIAKMLKLSQQLNKLSKPILVYLAALQDVPGNPLNFATTLATTAAGTTKTSYYVTSTCTESPTAVCQIQMPGQFDQKQAGPTPFPYAYGYGYPTPASYELGSYSPSSEELGLVVWLSGLVGSGLAEDAEEGVLGIVVRGFGLWA